jgi:hypothetical protein
MQHETEEDATRWLLEINPSLQKASTATTMAGSLFGGQRQRWVVLLAHAHIRLAWRGKSVNL